METITGCIRKIMKFITTFLFIIMIASCNTKSKTSIDKDLSKKPKDSLAFYFPINTFYKKPSVDSFVQNWYSSALYSLEEPVLYQNFIGHNIYRFLWLRSFHKPVVFSLHQSNGQVWLNSKMLDKQPTFHDDKMFGTPKELQNMYIKEGYIIDNKDSNLMIRIADRKANIIYNKTISLQYSKWDEFEQFIEKANYWKLPTIIDDGSTDGASWVIEGHLKNKYHVVDYHSPGGEYRKAGLFLIKLSGLQEKIY